MFWDLKGATVIPRRTRQRQIAATVTLLPACEEVPTTKSDMAFVVLYARIFKTDALFFTAGFLKDLYKGGKQKLTDTKKQKKICAGYSPAMPSNK